MAGGDRKRGLIGDELREKMVRNRESLVHHSEDFGSHIE